MLHKLFSVGVTVMEKLMLLLKNGLGVGYRLQIFFREPEASSLLAGSLRNSKREFSVTG